MSSEHVRDWRSASIQWSAYTVRLWTTVQCLSEKLLKSHSAHLDAFCATFWTVLAVSPEYPCNNLCPASGAYSPFYVKSCQSKERKLQTRQCRLWKVFGLEVSHVSGGSCSSRTSSRSYIRNPIKAKYPIFFIDFEVRLCNFLGSESQISFWNISLAVFTSLSLESISILSTYYVATFCPTPHRLLDLTDLRSLALPGCGTNSRCHWDLSEPHRRIWPSWARVWSWREL
jgi:hypothetical protein